MVMSIAPAARSDAPSLARIHADSLPDDFLPALGRGFLERVYYPAALSSTNAVTLVARNSGVPVGFVTVASHSDAFTADVLRGRWISIARYSLAACVRDARQIRRTAEVAHTVLFGQPDAVQGEIVFIAVSESHRGKGLGPQLVKSAMDYLRERRVEFCRTKTLNSNRGVIRMYERMGWKVRNRQRLIGRMYCVLLSPHLLDAPEHPA